MFGDRKQKYVRLGRYDEIVIFPDTLQHSDFKYLKPISAGFCYVDADKVRCFGESISLGLESLPEDSDIATEQIFGED